ncbi:MAG TPA: DUF1028 domain-containing protein [Candidatus Cybelea sp.]|nr:DUF1028 domain-containing protein [Candidatus Cybelea sp.]
MTFSIAGRCARTGMLGIAMSTSSIAVAARCPFARAKVGAVSTQNVTDPRLGPKGLDLLQEGMPAPEAMKHLLAHAPHKEYRQVIMVDAHGRTAHWTGAKALGTHGAAEGKDCVSAGNLLQSAGVPRAIVKSFEANAEMALPDRLMLALEEGVVAGGEQGPVHSAALLVMHEQTWPLVDLRVDWDDDNPISALRRLWEAYRPQMNDYVTRALDPVAAPRYGVPGDPK